jgi:hypothetical protein
VDTFQRSITNDEIKHFVQRWCYRSLDIITKHFFNRNKISGCEMPSLIGFVKKPYPVHEENLEQTCRVGRQFVSCSWLSMESCLQLTQLCSLRLGCLSLEQASVTPRKI